MERIQYHFVSNQASRILVKSVGLQIAYKPPLRQLVLYIPSAPVEEKGYKSIMNLPDWVNIHNIFIKSEKQFENGIIYLPGTCPFSGEQ
jgi:hypothetical protein